MRRDTIATSNGNYALEGIGYLLGIEMHHSCT